MSPNTLHTPLAIELVAQSEDLNPYVEENLG